jgi:soluble lytic murein transglycosylase-like protein
VELFTDDTARMSHRYLIVIATVVALGLPAQALADPEHEVTAGESLASIAAIDGLSVSQLAAANGLPPHAPLTTGAILQIPARSAAPTPPMSADAGTGQATADGSETSAMTGGYRVVSGDTLSGIAARYGVTVSALAAANGLNPAGLLTTSMTLTIPGASPATTGTATSAASSVSGAQPTGETVSPAAVGAVAASHGVSPSLAEAIADQESGFNNAEVSPTGAVGVMQIEPTTWAYLHTQLGVPALDPASASDNVLGGVELLRWLLDQTGGDPQLAAAGYYQGLGSVQAHGMYAGTRRYVADVTALQARFGGG